MRRKALRLVIYIHTERLTNPNKYTSNVAQVVRSSSQRHIRRENAINDFNASNEIPSMLETSVLNDLEVHGGSGFGAATVQDLGIEPTLRATSGEGKSKRVRKRITEVDEGLSAVGGVCTRGVCRVQAGK